MPSPPCGHLDAFEYREEARLLALVGWFLFLDGPAQAIRFEVKGGARGACRPERRADLALAFAHIPEAAGGGFRAEIDVPQLAPGQVIELELLLERPGRPAARVPLGYRRPAEAVPVPPVELMYRVADTRNEAYFLASGNRHANDVVRMLRRHKPLDRIGQFLDWGCGCGRVTRHLAGFLPAAGLCGADIDAEAIRWLAAALPRGEFHASGFVPPLPFAAGRFDFVLASSVFTHLTESHQAAWLDEMARILAPGGILLFTTHGPHAARMVNHANVLLDLERSGFHDGTPDDRLGAVASGDYYRATFQTAEFTRRLLAAPGEECFQELEMIEAGLNLHQDVWILARQ